MDKKALDETYYIAEALCFSGLLMNENVARLADLADDLSHAPGDASIDEYEDILDLRDELEEARLSIFNVAKALADKGRKYEKD